MKKEGHNPNLDVLEMAPVLLKSGWLLLWIIAICSLSGEDDGTTIPWHHGIHSTPAGSNCGAKGGCLLPEASVLTKGSSEVQSYGKLKGESFFWELTGLNRVTYCGTFPPWCLIHVFFSGAWPDRVCWLWPWVCELSVCIFKLENCTMENTAIRCIHVMEKEGNEAICYESI